MSAWQHCLEELKATAVSSMKKEHHNHFVYQVAKSQSLCNELFWEIANPDKAYISEVATSKVYESESKYATKLNIPLNLIFYGPPGTGKTFKVQNLAQNVAGRYAVAGVPHYHFITFHQSYSYEDFLEGIRPLTKAGQVHYEITKGFSINRVWLL